MTGGTQQRGTRSIASLAAVLLVAAGFSLSACAKRHLYDGDRRPDDQVAYIEAERFLLARVEFDIDGHAVGSLAQYYVPPGVDGSWLLGKPTVGASVLPGEHRLTVFIASFGWATAARTACAAMAFRTDAGKRYKLFVDNGTLVMQDLATGAGAAETSFAACLPPKNSAMAPVR